MIDIKHIAKLANLPLIADEEKDFQQQLAETIDYINQLQKIDTNKVEPTSQVTGKVNEFRDDVTTLCLSQEDALKNAKATHNGFFVSKVKWE